MVVLLWAGQSHGQGVLNDILSGKLVQPAVGQWAWYELKDADGKHRYAFRQAIVGEELVGGDKGYWLENELIPEVGFPSIWKLLVTGPANDPANVHRILVKQGRQAPREVPTDMAGAQSQGAAPQAKRAPMGKEKVKTAAGVIAAEHIILTSESGVVELWVNDDIKPMGIVRMRGREGELLLRIHGEGGPNAESKIRASDFFGGEELPRGMKVEVDVVPDDSAAPEPNGDRR